MRESDRPDELSKLQEELQEGRLELTLEFRRRRDGSKAGRILVRDAAGGVLADLPQESPEALIAALARLVVLGFEERAREEPAGEAAPPRPAGGTAPSRVARAAAEVPVAGIDGFRKGWVAVVLDPSGDVQVSTHARFVDALALRAQVIAVDMPIDPPGLGSRAADAAARAFLGRRASSVFSTPPRAALEAPSFAEANEIARTISGKGLSQQAFALARKILEVHELAGVDERVIEMHPEVSFCALAGGPLAESKHTAEGLARRRELLRAAGVEPPPGYPGVPEVDLLDAAVGAWTAARYARGAARAFPDGYRERLGAIWA